MNEPLSVQQIYDLLEAADPTETLQDDPHLTIPVTTYTHYSTCEPWLLESVGEWNIAWWRDFPDIAMMAVLGQVPQPDCYWFAQEKHAVLFKLKFA
jgi:hypothetical protein